MKSEKKVPELIVMLTLDDKTVLDAYHIFDSCKDSKAKYFGFKEEPLPKEEMKKLFSYMKACGKNTCLEVVTYTEEGGLEGAKTAVECGCDILMGTIFSDKINAFCKEHNLKYMPFVGKISQRPSILEGSIEDMIAEANLYIKKGVYGIDVLGYRYTGNCIRLNQEIVSKLHAPVCIAGSVNSLQRLDEVKAANPWAFTIGGAFFEHRFGDDICEQINQVYHYMNQ